MEAKPLSKKIYDRAKEYGVNKIDLHFSGGSDEGYLNVELYPYKNSAPSNFYKDIEDWAWEVYEYSGAGDGSDYGDVISYDLDTGKVTTSEWYTSRVDGDSHEMTLEVDDINKEEDDS